MRRRLVPGDPRDPFGVGVERLVVGSRASVVFALNTSALSGNVGGRRSRINRLAPLILPRARARAKVRMQRPDRERVGARAISFFLAASASNGTHSSAAVMKSRRGEGSIPI